MDEQTREIKPTLVLGGTGKTGRRVAQRLEARGRPVRIGSRSGEPPFDWEDRSTWATALHGVGSAYVSYYPDLASLAPWRRSARSPSWPSSAGCRDSCSSQAAASPRPSRPRTPCATPAPS